jgi:transposase
MNWYKRQLKIAMPAARNFTPQEVDQIKDLVMQGKSYKSIGEMFGTSITPIKRLSKKYKWRESRPSYSQREFSEDDLQIIKELLADGESFREVAELFEVSRPVIQRLNDKHKWREKRIFDDTSSSVSKVTDLFRSGLNVREISDRLNNEISQGQIRRILEKEGLVQPPARNSREEIERTRKERGEKDKQIVHMYLPPPEGLGMSLIDIAKHFGTTSHTGIKKSLIRSGLGDRIRSKEESMDMSGGRDRQKEFMRNWWKDPKNREEHIQKLKKKWQDPEYARMQSEKHKKWWEENAWAKEHWSDMMSEMGKERWQDPEYREKTLRNRFTPELLERGRQQMTERWQDPEMRSIMMKRRWDDKGGFWGWLASLPLETRLKVIDGMMHNNRATGKYPPEAGGNISNEQEYSLRNNLINKAVALDNDPQYEQYRIQRQQPPQETVASTNWYKRQLRIKEI